MNIGEGHIRKIRLIKVREGEGRILERMRDRKVAHAVRSGKVRPGKEGQGRAIKDKVR